jgi:hypothetical protein
MFSFWKCHLPLSKLFKTDTQKIKSLYNKQPQLLTACLTESNRTPKEEPAPQEKPKQNKHPAIPELTLFLSNNSAAATGSKVVSSSTTKQYEEQKKEKKRNSGDSSKVVSYMPLQNALSVCIKRKNPLHIH